MTLFLCLAVIFFSLAQPGILFAEAENLRLFFVVCGLATLDVLLQRSSGKLQATWLPQNKFIFGMLFAYTMSEAQYMWLSGTLDVFQFWLKKVILYWIVINVLQDWSALKKSFWCVVSATAILVALGWRLFMDPSAILTEVGRLQTVGNYNNPNSFALLLTCTFPLAFALIELERSLFKRALLVVFMGALVVSCVYTKSRGGSMGMLGAVVLSVFLSQRLFTSKGIKTLSVAGAVVVFFTYAVAIILMREDATNLVGSGGESSAGDRLMAWGAAFKMFADHPIFGIGWNKFAENALDYGMDKRLIAHNTLLSVLAETGLVGFTCFIAVLLLTLKQLVRMRREWAAQKDLEIQLILCNGVLISLLCFLINTSFSVKDHDPIYWILISLSGVLCKLSQTETAVEIHLDSPPQVTAS